MTRKTILLCSALAAGLFPAHGVCAAIGAGSVEPPAETKLETAEVPSMLPYIRRAKKATAWRMGSVEDPDRSRPSRRIYKLGTPVVLSEGQLSRLQGDLGRPENIGAGVSFCGFEPVIAVVLEGDDFSLELQFCFLCDEVSAVLDGRHVKIVSIEPGHAAYVGFFKAVFPGDKLVQSLPLKSSADEGKKTR